MLLHLGSIRTLVASSAEAAKEIMKTHDLSFCSRPNLTIPNILLYGSKSIAFAPYGEYWRQLKSLVMLKLLSNTRVKSYKKVRENEIDLMIQALGESCGTIVDMRIIEEHVNKKKGEDAESNEGEDFVDILLDLQKNHDTSDFTLHRDSLKDVAAGTQVFINAWAIGRDPALWEESNEFSPERFLNNSINYQSLQFKWLPFGASRRSCPGLQFRCACYRACISKYRLQV
ncbi:hypothetical protein SSX86_010317 [Deinandra increscens subsp. villosa]|uniref:Cytochrome P450 n=1 Tax=Deinandra increscens subsp. villosa TaxID=3103831 RepID=A0AAP0D7S4_9ASTR